MADVGRPPLDPSILQRRTFSLLRVSGPAPGRVPTRGTPTGKSYRLRGTPPDFIFAQVSLSVTMRLKTGESGVESGSTAK